MGKTILCTEKIAPKKVETRKFVNPNQNYRPRSARKRERKNYYPFAGSLIFIFDPTLLPPSSRSKLFDKGLCIGKGVNRKHHS